MKLILLHKIYYFQLNIRAEDGGFRSSEWASNVAVVFVNLTGEPVFDIQLFQTDFTGINYTN